MPYDTFNMHLIKDAYYRYVMKSHSLLKLANFSMLFTCVAFIISATLAFGYEEKFPLMFVASLHVAQLFLAGLFKMSYVIRLVALKQLGLAVS